ncbi:hypothetical protein OKZ62_001787 [Vibrio navarrensis]|nr:hypothetical protein [Vibrio navarrensis]
MVVVTIFHKQDKLREVMFKNLEDRLRSTQKNLTSAASTIRKEILNSHEVKSQFSQKELESLEAAESALLNFKNKVKHLKEKHLRAKKNAERVEANVKAQNEARVRKVVNNLPVNILFELSLLEHYYGQEFAEEVEVSLWYRNQLKLAATNPASLLDLVDSAKADVIDLLMHMLPNQQHRSGMNPISQEWDYYIHKPEPCSVEFIEEIVRKHVRNVKIRQPMNTDYLTEALKLVNLVRSVNQKIKDISKSND